MKESGLAYANKVHKARFHIDPKDLPRLLGYINEARAVRGEPPLEMKDIAEEIKSGKLTLRNLRS